MHRGEQTINREYRELLEDSLSTLSGSRKLTTPVERKLVFRIRTRHSFIALSETILEPQ